MVFQQLSVLLLQKGGERARDEQAEHVCHVDQDKNEQGIDLRLNSEEDDHLHRANIRTEKRGTPAVNLEDGRDECEESFDDRHCLAIECFGQSGTVLCTSGHQNRVEKREGDER